MSSEAGESAVAGTIPKERKAWLRLARAVWMLLAVAGTALFVIGPAIAWSTLETACHSVSSCASYQLDTSSTRALNSHGVSLVDFAAITTGILAITWLLWYGLAALIFWRKSEDRGALVAAYFLILFPQLAVSILIPWSPGAPAALLALILFGLLFPNGCFAPRWTRWLAVFTVAIVLLAAFPGRGISVLWIVPILIMPVVIIGLQIYRFRRISTWAERQETKWAFCGLVAGILYLLSFILLGGFVNHTQNGSLYAALTTPAFAVLPCAIPVAIAISVLRSGLWDIDRIISRVLAWSALTVILVGVYAGGVIGLGAPSRRSIGSSSVAIAVSTLAIVALFGPLRRWIQTLIDRRFYRSRYDAARTVAAFGERLRDQVDIAHLSAELTSVVRETLHPEHVQLWLRGSIEP